MGDKALNILASIVVVAGITALVLPGRQTPQVITALFNGFRGSLGVATGQGR